MLTTDSAELVNFGEIVDRQVDAGLGDKLAYIAGEDRLTYAELRGQINRAANLLVAARRPARAAHPARSRRHDRRFRSCSSAR